MPLHKCFACRVTKYSNSFCYLFISKIYEKKRYICLSWNVWLVIDFYHCSVSKYIYIYIYKVMQFKALSIIILFGGKQYYIKYLFEALETQSEVWWLIKMRR